MLNTLSRIPGISNYVCLYEVTWNPVPSLLPLHISQKASGRRRKLWNSNLFILCFTIWKQKKFSMNKWGDVNEFPWHQLVIFFLKKESWELLEFDFRIVPGLVNISAFVMCSWHNSEMGMHFGGALISVWRKLGSLSSQQSMYDLFVQITL